MNDLNSIYQILLSLIGIGTIMRCAYCFVQIMINGDERGQMKQRMKNAIFFAIIATCSGSLVYLIANNYFGLGGSLFKW